MLMVGSLVFFLVEVLYAGKYSGRLLYTLFFFVIGAVLVARIAIETDASRATLYGLLFGAVTYVALLAYVEYPGGGWLKSFGWLVNLGLLLLIWWSAHKLTWDCTHIDEKQKGGGRGVLSAAGLSADQESGVGSQESGKPVSREPMSSEASGKSPQRKKKKPQPDSRLWDWIEHYKKNRDAKRKGPHTPGVWVIYFALAALPLFALGQSLVDPDDRLAAGPPSSRWRSTSPARSALLVTTSLLGLRRYLRQRKAKIPTALAGGWLGLGAVAHSPLRGARRVPAAAALGGAVVRHRSRRQVGSRRVEVRDAQGRRRQGRRRFRRQVKGRRRQGQRQGRQGRRRLQGREGRRQRRPGERWLRQEERPVWRQRERRRQGAGQ